MNNRKRRALLLEAGFVHDRNGTKHEIWKKGERRVSLSYGSNVAPHTQRSFKSIVRRELTVEKAIAAARALINPPPAATLRIAPVQKEPEMMLNKENIVAPKHKVVGLPKFTLEERARVRIAIGTLRDQGKSVEDVALVLKAQGFKTPDGREPNKSFVMNQLVSMRKVATKSPSAVKTKRTVLPEVKIARSAPNELQLSILTDPVLSDKKKLALLSVLLN